MPNNNNSNNRGRFLLGRAASSSRRSQNKSNVTHPNSGRGGPKLVILDENIVSQTKSQSKTKTTRTSSTAAGRHPRPQQPQTQKQEKQKHVTYSSSPMANHESVDSTGFSKAELHDLEESFKLFDIYGEGAVQVGDLRGILEVLRQEQKEQEQQQQHSGNGSKYPHLKTLLRRLSELSDEDTLALNDYIQLMASTTISNASLIENNNGNHNGPGETDNTAGDHFARVFRLFDTDEKGYITRTDLERIAVELGEHDMTRGELQEMMDRALGLDENSNNGDREKRVGMEEFTKMMTMSLFPTD